MSEQSRMHQILTECGIAGALMKLNSDDDDRME